MRRIGDDVSRELGRFGVPPAMAEIVAAWPRIAGEGVARHAWPATLGRDGTLSVSTDSSVWAFELTQLAPTFLERLREALGDAAPKAIRFAAGAVPTPPAEPAREARASPPAPGAEERALADALAAGIEDEELRRLVARAVAASLAQPASDR
jgi:hypothetical protein